MKKYFFIFTTILIIFLCVIDFSRIPSVVEEVVGSIDTELIETQLAGTGLKFDGFIERIYNFGSLLAIIFNLILLVYADSGTILRHKVRAIAYSIATIFLSLNLLTIIIALVNTIVLVLLKRTEEKDMPIEAKPVEEIEYVKPSKGQLIKAFILVLIYVMCGFVIPNVVSSIEFEGVLDTLINVFIGILDIIVFISSIYIFRNELKTGWEAIKNNPEGYRRFIVGCVLIAFVCLFSLNALRIYVTGAEFTSNQQALNELPLGIVAILAIIWAPIVEEMLFRGVIRRFISNKIAFVVVSGLLFGLLHCINDSNIIIASLPYIGLGVCMSLAYARTNNIWTNVFMHMINNAFSVIVMYLVFGF